MPGLGGLGGGGAPGFVVAGGLGGAALVLMFRFPMSGVWSFAWFSCITEGYMFSHKFFQAGK